MSKRQILIIDDEEQIRKLLRIILESDGYAVMEAETAKKGFQMVNEYAPELILLDIGLPDISGHDLLVQLRKHFVNPIIMLSVRDSEEDIVKAIDNGANDYLIKPFRSGELLARIRAALKALTAHELNSKLQFGNLAVDLFSKTVKRNGQTIKLTSTEYDLLELFALHSGKVLTHNFILSKIWGMGYRETQHLRVFIGQLRKKIEENPNKPVHIITESGIGYRFNDEL